MKTTANTLNFSPLTTQDWVGFPKISLHEHIDGGLRTATLLSLSQTRGLKLPHQNPIDLGHWMQQSAETGNLVDYLRGFEHTVAAMASREACAQVTYELAEDCLAEGCVLAEFRMAPQLLEAHGLSAEAALEGMLEGLSRSTLPSGLIVCGMRMDTPERTLAAAQLAVKYKAQGVVAFDLAGAEFGFAPSIHQKAIEFARNAGLGITLHAGEADHGGRVLEAAQLGATRIGHGIRITEDAPERVMRLQQAQALGLHFEVCPSSNVHTGAAKSLRMHPVRDMIAAGLSLSIATDNRLMSGTTLCQELHKLHSETGINIQALWACQWQALDASFCSTTAKAKAKAALLAFTAEPI